MVEMKSNSNVEYLMSVHLLKKLKANHMISDEEFDAIDKENRRVFLKAESLKIA
ncbi:SHOCT domain-containing protein [Haloimpatiens massiliensis]|uniref:SHOCT domain-containing protein n=1 Tax=Haloimpatiens massiliensis TaxID=1658110 RepID=UPI0015E145DB|nr:SHOCT domain-containing protein [Haloimpatiens massiliensis]